MALPNTDLSVEIVRDELEATTNNVGQLCIHPNINKWSKWKPVRHSYISREGAPANIQANWWKGADNKMGINKTWVYHDQLRQNNNGYNLFMTPIWTYLAPRGGTYNEPYRLDDFRNYEHNTNWVNNGMVGRPLQFDWSSDLHFHKNGSLRLSMMMANIPEDNLLTFTEAVEYTLNMGFIFQIPDANAPEADSMGFIYRIMTAPIMMPSGQTITNNNLTIRRIDDRIWSFELSLKDNFWDAYIGKNIVIRPVITQSPIYLDTAPPTSVFVTVPALDIDFLSQMSKSYTLKSESAYPDYKAPSINVSFGNVTRNGDVISIAGLIITIKKEDNVAQNYNIRLSSINGVTLTTGDNPNDYNIYATKTPYNSGNLEGNSDYWRTLSWNGVGVPSQATIQYNDPIQITSSVDNTKLVKVQLLIGIKVLNFNDSVQDAFLSIAV